MDELVRSSTSSTIIAQSSTSLTGSTGSTGISKSSTIVTRAPQMPHELDDYRTFINVLNDCHMTLMIIYVLVRSLNCSYDHRRARRASHELNERCHHRTSPISIAPPQRALHEILICRRSSPSSRGARQAPHRGARRAPHEWTFISRARNNHQHNALKAWRIEVQGDFFPLATITHLQFHSPRFCYFFCAELCRDSYFVVGGELVVTFCINYNFEMTTILSFSGIGTSSLQRLNCRSKVEVTQNPSPPFRLS